MDEAASVAVHREASEVADLCGVEEAALLLGRYYLHKLLSHNIELGF